MLVAADLLFFENSSHYMPRARCVQWHGAIIGQASRDIRELTLRPLRRQTSITTVVA